MGLFLLFAIPGKSALATVLAGLLTYGSDEVRTFPHFHAVVFAHLSPLTAAGTALDSHELPLTNAGQHIFLDYQVKPETSMTGRFIIWQDLPLKPTLCIN